MSLPIRGGLSRPRHLTLRYQIIRIVHHLIAAKCTHLQKSMIRYLHAYSRPTEERAGPDRHSVKGESMEKGPGSQRGGVDVAVHRGRV